MNKFKLKNQNKSNSFNLNKKTSKPIIKIYKQKSSPFRTS